jgi:DNA uptake protein ComE-like DNA-binding protein
MSSRRSKMYSKNRQNRDRGIALISVLWALLLLSGLAGAAAFMARTNAILTHRLGEFAQAEATTDAAIVNAISILSDEKASRHPRIDGQPQTSEFQGIPVAVSISNEAGRIDINTADDDLILAFLYSQGVGEDRATAMLSDLRKYQHVANGPAPPGTLRTVDEIKKISSWAAQNLDCWADALTVYTGLPSVNSSDAPEQVDAALKWARDHHIGNRVWAGASVTPSASSDQSLLGEVIRIVASTSPSADITASSEWIGRLTGDVDQPTLTMKWSRMGTVRNASCKDNVK